MRPDLAACFEERRAHLHAVARAIVGTRADADDVLQDAWLQASGGDHGPLRSPAAWMTTMVRNLALDRRRHRQVAERFAAHEVVVQHRRSEEDAFVERLEAAAVVRRIVALLDAADAAALLLQVAFGEDHAALAERSGRNVGAMRVALHRARRRLRDSPTTARDPVDADAVDRTFAVCWHAIVARDAAPLHALLSAPPPANRSVVHAGTPASDEAPAVRVASVQVAGRYLLALRQGDRLICVLPIGVTVEADACPAD